MRFFTSVCAIVGGTYTIMGIVDKIVNVLIIEKLGSGRII
jgi:hypothetical protein